MQHNHEDTPVLEGNLKRLLSEAYDEQRPSDELRARVKSAMAAEMQALQTRVPHRKRSMAWGAAACLAVVVGGVWYGAERGPIVGRVACVSGCVRAGKALGSRRRPVAAGANVRQGSVLETLGEARAAVLLADGSELKVASGTTIGFTGPRGLHLHDGKVWAQVQRSAQAFRIATKHGTAVVRGTSFQVETSAKRTVLTVARGAVDLTRGAGHARVEAGQSSSITDRGEPTAPVAADPLAAMAWASAVHFVPDKPISLRAAELMQVGRWQEAAAVCRTWCRREPTNPEAHGALASALRATGILDGAVRAYYMSTFYYWERRWLRAAIGEAREGLEIDPYNPSLRRLMRKLIYTEAPGPRGTEVRKCVDEWLAVSPDTLLPHLFLGLFHSAERRYSDAIEEMRTALKINDLDPAPYRSLAEAFRHERDYTQARANLRMAAAIAPRSAETAVERLRLDIAQGIDIEERLVELTAMASAGDVDAHVTIGEFLSELGISLDDARKAHQRALELAPRNPEALRGLGRLAIGR